MARFERLQVLNTLVESGLVPLFYHADAAVSQEVVAALGRGGTRLVEFTNRGDFAVDVFSALVKAAAKAQPDVIIGVGSVDDAPTAALYMALGANFVVGPTFNVDVARVCNRHKVAYMPGCLTVTEIANAEEWGVEVVKVFPGNIGGPEFVKAVRGPRPWTRIMPTGGVTPDEANLKSWFDAGVACVGIGSQLVRSDRIKAGDYGAMEALTRTTLETISRLRHR